MAIKTLYFDGWLDEVSESSDKVLAITGTTSGTGYWAAVFAIRKNVKALILLNRDSSRVKEAFQKLEEEKENSGSSTVLYNIECDLMDFGSVKRGAKEVNEICQKYGGLNALANNAGFGPVADYRTKDGYDAQMQVNFLSHYLLTKCVFPSFDLALENGKEVRVCQQTSGVRYDADKSLKEEYFVKSKEKTLGGDGTRAGLDRYWQSKVACLAFALVLSKKLEENGYDTGKIKSLCSEPGFAETKLVSNSTADSSLFIKILAKVVIRVMSIRKKRQSAADGSLPIIHACLGEGITNGDFINPSEYDVGTPVKAIAKGKLDRGKAKLEKSGLDLGNQELTWEMTAKELGDFFEFAKKIG